MDKLEQYRAIIDNVIHRYAQHRPSHGQIESIPICDADQDNYLLMDMGWDNTGRVHAPVLHLRLRNEKVWIEWDGTEQGVTQHLLEAGIPHKDVVLGFYRPERRALTEFAVA